MRAVKKKTAGKKAAGKAPAQRKHKILIVYHSQTGNTEKVAKAIAAGIGKNAVLMRASEAKPGDFARYDIIGFGTGTYFGKPGCKIVELVEGTGTICKRVFVFATYGMKKMGDKAIKRLELKLEARGASVGKHFGCKGFDAYGPLRLIGGINKGKPDDDDLKEAYMFGNMLL